MELLLDQATLTLNFLSANLNLRAAYPSVNPARTEQLRLELLRDPPVPVPAILDEQFFIIATNAYKEHLMPLRELFAVAKSQDEDLNKWNDAYQTYANDLLPKLRQWAQDRLKEVDKDDRVAHNTLATFSTRLRWVLSGVFNDYRFGMPVACTSVPIPCGTFLINTAKGLTVFSTWLDIVFLWVEPFHRFPFAMHQTSATSALLIESLSHMTERRGLRKCYHKVSGRPFLICLAYQLIAVHSSWG